LRITCPKSKDSRSPISLLSPFSCLEPNLLDDARPPTGRISSKVALSDDSERKSRAAILIASVSAGQEMPASRSVRSDNPSVSALMPCHGIALPDQGRPTRVPGAVTPETLIVWKLELTTRLWSSCNQCLVSTCRWLGAAPTGSRPPAVQINCMQLSSQPSCCRPLPHA